MRKQVVNLFLCAIVMAMFLTACGKKEEISSQPTVVEIPIEEAETTQVIEEDEEEAVEEEVAVTEKDKGNTTDLKQVGSSTPKKNADAITRSLESAPKYQYIEENVVPIEEKPLFADNTQFTPELGEASTNKTEKSDDFKEDSDDKSEDNSTSNPTDTPQPEYPLIDADPLAKNKEVLNSALWRERLNGNQMFFLPVKDFYFASKDVTPSQMKQEINSLVGQVPCIKDITYVTSHKDGIDLDSYVTVYVEEGALFGSRKSFDDKYANTMSKYEPLKVELPSGNRLENVKIQDYYNVFAMEDRMKSFSDGQYVKLQLATYEFFLSYAMKCNTPQSEDTVHVYKSNLHAYKETMIHDYCDIPFEDIAAYFVEYRGWKDFIRYYDSLQSEDEKNKYLETVSSVLMDCAPDMCFWLEQISVKDTETLTVKFSMFPVYETKQEQDGTIIIDKTRYKSIATMAKEVDDKINQVVESVIEPDMSALAKEYALFHYCDTYYKYDGGNELGDTYAIGDNPYTIGTSIDSATGKKAPSDALYSTQNEFSIYTTAMTGWGVCEGHAYFYSAICTKTGIRCEHGEGQGHAWNVVLMNDRAYLVDAGRRAPYPHFNIGHEWNNTYEVIDNKMYTLIKDDMRYAESDSPIPLYQAGYVKDTTQQDGEWIYYINFDDNGSLYKINVDGSRNQKIQDSGTTIEAAYQAVVEKYGENENWPKQWANAQYGQKYKGEGYTNSGAISYRWAVGHNFFVRKENGSIVYEVMNNPSASCSIPMTNKKTDCINLSWNNDDAYSDLGILSGTVSVDTIKSPGDSIDKIIAVVDGEEYPMSDVTIKEDGREADFTFRLPTDRGMEHHDLELFVTTANGGVKRQEVMTQDLRPAGIRESYLWNGKYYTIEGITAKEGLLTVFVNRYMEDGTLYDSKTLSCYEYDGKESANVSFETYMIEEDRFLLVLPNGESYYIALPLIGDSIQDCDAYFSDVDNKVYLFNAKGFCRLMDQMDREKYLDAVVEVCADLDFSTLPEGYEFEPVGDYLVRFKGVWRGNNYKMKGLNLDQLGNASIFAYLYNATVQDVYICDSSIISARKAGVFGVVGNSDIRNIRVENVDIKGTEDVGVVAYAETTDIHNCYLKDVNIQGDCNVGGLCGSAINTSINGVQVLGNSKISGNSYVGGVVGLLKNDSSAKYCLSEAEVVSKKIAGGIVGEANQTKNISYCMNYGNVITSGMAAGGIVGRGSGTEEMIYHVENYGDVSAISYAGGIAGFLANTVIDIAVNNGDINGTDHVGGIIGCNSADGGIRCCENKGKVVGDRFTGIIIGKVDESAKIYHTLCTPWEPQLTYENMPTMFGEMTGDITILTDIDFMPYEAGRWAYCRE